MLAESIRVDVIAPVVKLKKDSAPTLDLLGRLQQSMRELRTASERCKLSFRKYVDLYRVAVDAAIVAGSHPPMFWEPPFEEGTCCTDHGGAVRTRACAEEPQ